MKVIVVTGSSRDFDEELVAAYLPDNYKVLCELPPDGYVVIGFDVAGWTAEDYVVPRLGSALMAGRIVEKWL